MDKEEILFDSIMTIICLVGVAIGIGMIIGGIVLTTGHWDLIIYLFTESPKLIAVITGVPLKTIILFEAGFYLIIFGGIFT